MKLYGVLLVSFLVFNFSCLLVSGMEIGLKKPSRCPCISPTWCNPVTDTSRKEIFAFSVKNDSTHWEKFDWSKVTTVVMSGYISKDLMCMAHALNVRVSYIADINIDFRYPTLRRKWIQDQLNFMQEHFLDGINFDYESVIDEHDDEARESYTKLVGETNAVLKKVLPYSQVTVDVAWKKNADQRFYDYPALANNADFLFVMGYDEQSQIFDECVAKPNAGFYETMRGLSSYVGLHIPTDKLVIGVPWYGYIYPCIKMDGDNCFIKHVPFRGVNCSDAAGKQYTYSYIQKLSTIHTVKWNVTSSTPYFTYTDVQGTTSYQVHYDNPESLTYKYKMALKMKLRGVGMWNIDGLDYEDTTAGLKIRTEMFGALPSY